MSDDNSIHAFRSVPRTGVIYVTTEAGKHGYTTGAPDWCNLGQGQPDTGTEKGSSTTHELLSHGHGGNDPCILLHGPADATLSP